MAKLLSNLVIVFFITGLFNTAWAGEQEAKFYAVTDTITTIVAISQGAVETNPLGPLATIALKPIALNLASELPENQKKYIFDAQSSLWGAATANNLCVITGGTSCLTIGVIYGIVLWIRNTNFE